MDAYAEKESFRMRDDLAAKLGYVTAVCGDLKRDTYYVSKAGTIHGWVKQKFGFKQYHCCNPMNENGYYRITLKSESGKSKKYLLHRIILASFLYDDPTMQVNHKDNDPSNCRYSNLEYVTNLENRRWSAITNAAMNSEGHHKAIITNSDVEWACAMFVKGYDYKEVANILFEKCIGSYDEIRLRKVVRTIYLREKWNHISDRYRWEAPDMNVDYSKSMVRQLIEYIIIDGLTDKKIIKKYPLFHEGQLKKTLTQLRRREAYEKEYKSVVVSADIKRNRTPRDRDGFLVLIPKKKAS